MLSRSARRFTPVAAVSLLLASVGIALSVAPAGATDSLSVDCTTPPAETIYWSPVGGALDVTTTNCDTYEIFDPSVGPVASGAAVGTLSVTTGFSLTLSVGGSPVFALTTRPLYPGTVPSGQLLVTQDAPLPIDAPQMDVGAPDGGGSEHALGGIDGCNLQSGGPVANHVYSTITMEITAAGEYTFRGVATDPISSYLSSLGASNPISDPFLALYSTFDPTTPDEGVIGCNDDLNDLFGYSNTEMAEQLSGGRVMEGHLPYFTTNLEPGQYTLVLTLWEEVSSTQWETIGPGSVTFEMWGPADSICIVGTTCGTEPTPVSEPDPVVPSYTG
jgi:hypothetical protein